MEPPTIRVSDLNTTDQTAPARRRQDASPMPEQPQHSAHDKTRTAGRRLLGPAALFAELAALAAVFMVGPFGLAIVVPALAVIWLMAGASSSAAAGGG